MNEKLAISIECDLVEVIIDADTKQVLGVVVHNGNRTASFGETATVDDVRHYNWIRK